MKKLVTLCLVEKDDQVLLGMKKRGFGAGLYNGFGGKIESNETVMEAAARELHEEAGIKAGRLEHVGVLLFTFRDEPELKLEMHIFKTSEFDGVPVESEEMRPQWFSRDSIPYEYMWTSDAAWFPIFLAERKFTGSFCFDKPASPTHTAVILEQQLIFVEQL